MSEERPGSLPQIDVRALPGNVLPTIAIVGRPNVGKSTLFNRLVRRRQAIVRGEPGTTRDRNYADTEWRGQHFSVIDTGGLLGEQLTGPFANSVAEQVEQAMAEADAIVLVGRCAGRTAARGRGCSHAAARGRAASHGLCEQG